MKSKLKKFNMLYESVMKMFITEDVDDQDELTFSKTENEITCQFNIQTEDEDKIVTVIAIYDIEKGTKTFSTFSTGDKEVTILDENEFMSEYPDEYNRYVDELRKQTEDETSDIISFDKQLQRETDSMPIEIQEESTKFIFTIVKDELVKNLIKCEFEIDDALHGETITMLCQILIKLRETNSLIVKIVLSEENRGTVIISESDFKDKYLNYFNKFKNALQKYENKEYELIV